jgi:hypothetical protein
MGRITSRSWTPEEIIRLEHLADNGASVARASAALKRTQCAVKAMSRKLGVPLLGVRQIRANVRNQAANG